MGAFISLAIAQISVNSTTNNLVARVGCESFTAATNISLSANVTSGPAVIEDFRAHRIIGSLDDFYLFLSISEGTSVESTIEWGFTCLEPDNDPTTETGNLTVSPDPSQVIFTEFEEEYCVSPDTPVGTRLFRVEAVNGTGGSAPLHTGVGIVELEENYVVTSATDLTLGQQDDFLVVAGDPSSPAAGKVSVIHILDCRVSAPTFTRVTSSDGCESANLLWTPPTITNVTVPIRGYTVHYQSYQGGVLISSNSLTGLSSNTTTATVEDLPTADYHVFQVKPDTMAGGSGNTSNSLPLACVVPTTQSTDSQSTPTMPSTGSSPVQTPLKGLVLAIVMGAVAVGIV